MKKFVLSALSMAVLSLGVSSFAQEKVAKPAAEKKALKKYENAVVKGNSLIIMSDEKGMYDLACELLREEVGVQHIIVIDTKYEFSIKCIKKRK
jgi:hypothetical protein